MKSKYGYSIFKTNGYKVEVVQSFNTKKEAMKELRKLRRSYKEKMWWVSPLFNNYVTPTKILPFFRTNFTNEASDIIYQINENPF